MNRGQTRKILTELLERMNLANYNNESFKINLDEDEFEEDVRCALSFAIADMETLQSVIDDVANIIDD